MLSVKRIYLKRSPILSACQRQYHISSNHPHLVSKGYALKPNNNRIQYASVRTIVYNQKMADRGMHDDFGVGFSREGGLDKFGTFEGMEEFLTDKVPELTVNVVPVLEQLSITNAWPTVVLAHTFDNIQMLTGLPWFATIALVAASVKIGLYPLHIWWRKDFQDLVKSLPLQITTFLKTYFSNVIQNGSNEALKMAYQARKETCVELNLPQFPSLFPIYATTLIPITAVIGLCHLTNLTYEPLLTGGYLWFSNLSEADPYMILPVLNSALIIANARFHPFGLLLPKPVFTVGFLFQVPLGILSLLQFWCPTSLLVYWISANSVGLLIQLLLRTNAVREKHGLESRQDVLRPFLDQSPALLLLGDQVGSAKTQLLEIKKTDQKLLEDMNSSQSVSSEVKKDSK